MKASPKISIITACYNCSAHLEHLIDSVKAQSYADWELIVVDDASIDHTHSTLRIYGDLQGKLIKLRNQRNLGPGASRNRGIHRARGDYIAILDADDICVPHRLERQIDFLLFNPDIDVLGSGVEAIDQQGRSLEYRYRPETHDELAARIFYENPFYHSTVMARRRFFKKSGGYHPRYRRCQDYDLWLRTFAKFRFHNLQEPLVRYRVRDTVSWQSACYSSVVLLAAMRRERILKRNWWIAFRSPVRKLLERIPHSGLLSRIAGVYHRKKRFSLKIL